jgi:hypothetical protein
MSYDCAITTFMQFTKSSNKEKIKSNIISLKRRITTTKR